MFPAALNRGVFVGFHGVFNSGGTANEENPVVFADPNTGKYFDFISNDEPNIGHIDGATSTADSLFLSDVAPERPGLRQPGHRGDLPGQGGQPSPVFGAIANQNVNEGQTLRLAVPATDKDPGQALTYSLAAGTPAGASIDPSTGLFTWTTVNGPGTTLITVLATDNGSPALHGSTSFSITVNNVAPTVSITAPPFEGPRWHVHNDRFIRRPGYRHLRPPSVTETRRSPRGSPSRSPGPSSSPIATPGKGPIPSPSG